VSACPDALVRAAADHPPTAARAARLAKFKREQRIVEYLNRGVSVAEIATRIGVGEKRLRAVIRDILDRRMPHPPEEFVAIQVSRLNEALLVAFSAMSPSNLKAVDQVVKIVRELDRYGGAFVAEWARPAASRLDAPTEADVAFAKAWLGEAELEGESSEDRPEIPLQGVERIESAPGNPLAQLQRGEEPHARPGLAPPPPLWGRIEVGGRANVGDLEPWGVPNWEGGAAPHPVLPPQGGKGPKSPPALSGDGEKARPARPEIPLQVLEKMESAPGITAGQAAQTPVASFQLEESRGEELAGVSVPASQLSHPDRLPLISGASLAKERPEISAQGLERVQSAPGIGLGSRTAEATATSPISAPDLMLIPGSSPGMLRSAAGSGDLHACLSQLRLDPLGVASPYDGGDVPFPAMAGRDRPQDLAQVLENMEFAP
jgi:hypothetical protein